jgi:glycosyltransferase involved in cell wall biosynthesis
MKNLKSKNLLIITNGYPNKDGSIIDSVFVKNQVDELSKYFKKINVFVLNPYYPKILFKLGLFKEYSHRLSKKDYNYENICVFYTNYYKLPNKISYKTFNLYNSVLKTIKKNNLKFDLIHAHFTFPSGYVASKLKDKFNKRLIVTGHGFDVYDFPFRSKHNLKIFEQTLKKTDFFITVSKNNLNIVNSLVNIKGKSKVIVNGFNKELFFPLDQKVCRNKLKLPLDKKILLLVGNYLINIKNQINLIKSIKELTKKRKDVVLYLIGKGKDENKIKQKVKDLNLEEYVKVIGPKPHKEIPLWMNAADLFVFPSYTESFGVVNIEALACKTPVISTINGGSEEIITSEDYGFLLKDPKDYRTLAKLINKGLNKKWDYNKIYNYSKKYSWGNIVKEILKIYKRL